jgi:hypothetical protein
MPITYSRAVATCRGRCAAEEAEALAAWIGERQWVLIDLAEATHLHTAVVQVILAAPACVVAQAPQDALLRTVLLPALARNPMRQEEAAAALQEAHEADTTEPCDRGSRRVKAVMPRARAPCGPVRSVGQARWVGSVSGPHRPEEEIETHGIHTRRRRQRHGPYEPEGYPDEGRRDRRDREFGG